MPRHQQDIMHSANY